MATIPSIAMIPSGYKASKVYSVLPTDGTGDLTFLRAGALPSFNATRVNSEGLIEEVLSNVPRLDYSDGGCPSLLVEPQSTNLLLRSEEFDNASWTNVVGGTGVAPIVTANAGIAPDGNTTADRIQLNVGAGTLTTDFSILNQLVTTSAVQYAYSVYLKSNTGTNQFISIRFNSAPSQNITITPEWQKFVFVGTAAAGSRGFGFDLRGNNPSGEKTADFLAWGAQLEALPYATSYIPTVASTVTRVAETVSKTGISALIGQTEGTLFVDYNKAEIANSSGILELGELNNEIVIWQNTASQLRFFIRVNGSVFGSRTFNFSDERLKIALTYQTDSYSVFLNGVKILNNIPITSLSSSYNGFILGNRFTNPATSALNSGINLSALFKTALTDQECINLTTL
jgi:hypothetical protein